MLAHGRLMCCSEDAAQNSFVEDKDGGAVKGWLLKEACLLQSAAQKRSVHNKLGRAVRGWPAQQTLWQSPTTTQTDANQSALRRAPRAFVGPALCRLLLPREHCATALEQPVPVCRHASSPPEPVLADFQDSRFELPALDCTSSTAGAALPALLNQSCTIVETLTPCCLASSPERSHRHAQKP